MCAVCNDVFPDKHDLAIHLVEHQDDFRKDRRAELQGKTYELEETQELKILLPPPPGQTQTLHILHGISDEMSKEYTNIKHCFTCMKHFPTNEELQKHIPVHYKEIEHRQRLSLSRKAFRRAKAKKAQQEQQKECKFKKNFGTY